MRFQALTCALSATLVLCQTLSSSHLEAYKYTSDLGGGGYQEVRDSPAIAPAVVFALVTIGAIVAIVIKSEGHEGHSHSH